MFILANFIEGLAQVLNLFITFYWWVVVIRALLTWVNPDPNNPIVQFLERSTEPVLEPFRRLVPPYKIGIDLSPLFVLALLYFSRIFIVQSLMGIAFRLR